MMTTKMDKEFALIEIERRRKENPLEYYNKGDKIHKKQIEFHSCPLRNRWLFGGNRTGKTVSGATETVYRARGNHPYRNITKPQNLWVVSLTNEVQRDVTQKEILRWLPKKWIKDIQVRQGRKDDPENAIIDFIVVESIHGGNSIIGFKSCEQGREKFQGTSQDGIWFDEECPISIYDECKMRLIDTRGDIWGTMTPLKGLTWVYDLIYLNEIQDPEVKAWTMEWADNPFLSPDEIACLESTLTDEQRESRQYGRFVAMSGLVYKEFREDIHIIEPFNVPAGWYDNISIDPGYSNPLSCHFYACDGDGNVYVIEEHFEAEQSIEYHARKILEIADSLQWPRRNGKLLSLIDSAADSKTLAAEKSQSQLFNENGIRCNGNVNKDIWTGIQRVKYFLTLKPYPDNIEVWPRGKPKLFIFSNCVNMIREIKSYRWMEPREGVNAQERPKKAHDHSMDELRYYIMSKPDPFKESNKKPAYCKGGNYFRSELEARGLTSGQIKILVKKREINLLN